MENALRFGVADRMRFSRADGLDAVDPDEVDTIVCAGMGGDLIAQLAAAVGGTVVHQQHFKRHFDFLLQDAVYALFQVRFGIVDRYDHTDSDMFHRVSSLSSLLSGVPRLWRPRKRPTDSR